MLGGLVLDGSVLSVAAANAPMTPPSEAGGASACQRGRLRAGSIFDRITQDAYFRSETKGGEVRVGVPKGMRTLFQKRVHPKAGRGYSHYQRRSYTSGWFLLRCLSWL